MQLRLASNVVAKAAWSSVSPFPHLPGDAVADISHQARFMSCDCSTFTNILHKLIKQSVTNCLKGVVSKGGF